MVTAHSAYGKACKDLQRQMEEHLRRVFRPAAEPPITKFTLSAVNASGDTCYLMLGQDLSMRMTLDPEKAFQIPGIDNLNACLKMASRHWRGMTHWACNVCNVELNLC